MFAYLHNIAFTFFEEHLNYLTIFLIPIIIKLFLLYTFVKIYALHGIILPVFSSLIYF
nr:MAG TPA: hypothetical protein [Bacteriophage sp.]